VPKAYERRTAARDKIKEAIMNPLVAPIPGSQHQTVASVEVDMAPAGKGRVKRLIYPPGFRWSTHMKPLVKTDRCMHAHVGFLAQGRIAGEYGDGCRFEMVAPRVVVIEGDHDAWVEGSEPAVLIQFDTEQDTARTFGLAERHRHA
jgi:hypothetical protein